MKIRKLFLIGVLALVQIGCVYVQRVPQFHFAFKTDSTRTMDRLSADFTDIGRRYGYLEKIELSNAKYLAESGMFDLMLQADDGSFIDLSNMVRSGCVVISVYSSKGEGAAKLTGDAILQSLSRKGYGELSGSAGAGCND